MPLHLMFVYLILAFVSPSFSHQCEEGKNETRLQKDVPAVDYCRSLWETSIQIGSDTGLWTQFDVDLLDTGANNIYSVSFVNKGNYVEMSGMKNMILDTLKPTNSCFCLNSTEVANITFLHTTDNTKLQLSNFDSERILSLSDVHLTGNELIRVTNNGEFEMYVKFCKQVNGDNMQRPTSQIPENETCPTCDADHFDKTTRYLNLYCGDDPCNLLLYAFWALSALCALVAVIFGVQYCYIMYCGRENDDNFKPSMLQNLTTPKAVNTTLPSYQTMALTPQANVTLDEFSDNSFTEETPDWKQNQEKNEEDHIYYDFVPAGK